MTVNELITNLMEHAVRGKGNHDIVMVIDGEDGAQAVCSGPIEVTFDASFPEQLILEGDDD